MNKFFAILLILFCLFCGCSRSGETITLRFVDEDGKPVADVQTRIHGKNPALESNREGICTLTLPEYKSFHIYAWHPDYVYLCCAFGAYGIDPIPKELTLHLERGCEVGGVIVDEQGSPVKGVPVNLYYKRDYGYVPSPYPADLYQTPTTDDEGRWSVTQIPTKKFQPLTLSVSAAGFAPQRINFEQEDESFQSLLDRSHQTVLSPGLKLAGKIVAEGNPDLERTVMIVRNSSLYRAKINVSKTGDFQLNDLAPDTYWLQITPENYAPVVISETLSADSAPLEIQLKRGKPIRFRVTDTEGKPMSDVEMRIFFLRNDKIHYTVSYFSNLKHVIKPTDTEGRTVLENAFDESCSYGFYHKDYIVTSTPDWTPSEEEYPVTMCRKITVRGTVVDAETKRAVPRFWAAIIGWAEPQEGDEDNEDFDPSGWNIPVGAVFPFVEGDISYKIEPMLFAERCIVYISAHGYEPAISEEFSLKDGDREFNFELKWETTTQP